MSRVDVVYDADGKVIALGLPPKAPNPGTAQADSGPDEHPGYRVARLDLPEGVEVNAGLARMRVDTTADKPKLVAP